MSDNEHSDSEDRSCGGGGRREGGGGAGDETPRKGAQAGSSSKSLFRSSPALVLSDDEDIKSFLLDKSPAPPTPKPTPAKSKGKKKVIVEELTLSSGSDTDADARFSASALKATSTHQSETHAILSSIRAVVPDVDPHWLVETYKARGGNADVVVEEFTREGANYPLRKESGGGWKLGHSPERRKKKARTPEESEEEEEEDELDDDDEEEEEPRRKKKSPAKAKKAKTPSPVKKGKKRAVQVESSDDEDADDEEEVDQLASDDEAEEEEEEEELPLLSKEEAMDDRDLWLDVETRKPGGDTYKKAALDQLYWDYNRYVETHIRQIFESDKCSDLYAPAWFELDRLAKDGVLNKRRSGPRDMTKPIRGVDGKEHARPEVPPSKLLNKEKHWLKSYFKHKLHKVPYQPPGLPPKKKKPAPGPATPQRRKIKKSATKQALGGASKKKRARSHGGGGEPHGGGGWGDYDDEDVHDCEYEAGLNDLRAEGVQNPEWFFYPPRGKKAKKDHLTPGRLAGGVYAFGIKEEPDVEAFAGAGRRLGD
ncbi:hypothetical protein JCM8097_008634 [Rhodosporidiobolus ruineniae]